MLSPETQSLCDAIHAYRDAREIITRAEPGSEAARFAIAHALETWHRVEYLADCIS